MSKQSELVDLTQIGEGNLSGINATLTGYLRGPATFVIDPAVHGNNTGTVQIAGNLQVDGTQTIINSTTLTVDDKNIVLASGAADANAATGAGITVDGASANITYTSATNEWDFNKDIHVTNSAGKGVKIDSGGAIVGGGASGGDTQLMYWGGGPVYYGRSALGGTVSGHEFRVAGDTKLNINSSGDAVFKGNVGVGNQVPADRLHIAGGHLLLNNAVEVRSKDTSGNVKTITRVNNSNELEYGWSANAPVKFMGGGSYTERMRIHTNSNIGINDIAPHGTLTVTGPRILVQRTNDDSSIAFANNTTGAPASHTWAAGLNYSNSNAFTIAYGASGVPSLESHKMVIDTNGYVGIGTDNPDQKLVVKGVIETEASNSTNGFMMYTYTDNTYRINYNGAGADELILTSGGVLGLGTTPGAWSSNYPALQIGQGATFTGHKSNTQTQLGQNWWIGTGNQYVVNGAASRLLMSSDSSIAFSQASSGNAGAAISATDVFVIDTSGRVGIGTGANVTTNAHANADDLVIGNTSTRTGMTIVSDPAQSGAIHFSDGTSTGNANIKGQVSYEHGDNSFRFYINSSTEALRLGTSGGTVFNNGQDINQNFVVKASGNASALVVDGNGGAVGIGCSPAAWWSNSTALQVSPVGALYNTSNYEDFNIANNSYFNSSGTERYIQNDAACKIRLTDAGLMDFRVAGAGTAGNAISWNTAMAITALGRVGVGITQTDPVRFEVDSGTNEDKVVRIRLKDDNNSNATANPFSYEYKNLEIENTYSGAAPSANGTKVAKLQLTTVTAGGYAASASIMGVAESNSHEAGAMVFATGPNSSGNEVERMRIGRLGEVTMPHQIGFKARGNTSQWLNLANGSTAAWNTLTNTIHAGNGTDIGVNLTTVTKNNFNCWNTGNDFDLGTGKFTAPVAGVYLISGTFYGNKTSSANLSDVCFFLPYINAQQINEMYAGAPDNLPTGSTFTSNFAHTVYLEVGDYVQWKIYASSSNTQVYGDHISIGAELLH